MGFQLAILVPRGHDLLKDQTKVTKNILLLTYKCFFTLYNDLVLGYIPLEKKVQDIPNWLES